MEGGGSIMKMLFFPFGGNVQVGYSTQMDGVKY